MKVPKLALGLNTKYNQFLDSSGNVLNPDDYLKLVVGGDSLDLFGINHNDLIFCEELDSLTDISFPCICLFKRSDYLKEQTENKAEYLVNKVWYDTVDFNYTEDVNNLLLSLDFDIIKQDSRFVNFDYIYDNLDWNFKSDTENPAVIVSRLDKTNHWILEFRRLSDIVAIVKHSFSQDL